VIDASTILCGNAQYLLALHNTGLHNGIGSELAGWFEAVPGFVSSTLLLWWILRSHIGCAFFCPSF
jgi:hypothetical protein